MVTRSGRIRRWIVVICYGVAGAIFWGGVVAIAARYIFGIDQRSATLFVGLPISLLIAVYLIPRLPRALNFDD